MYLKGSSGQTWLTGTFPDRTPLYLLTIYQEKIKLEYCLLNFRVSGIFFPPSSVAPTGDLKSPT